MAANSVFARLNYNFEDSKFGGSLYLTNGTIKYLNASNTSIPEWQQNDIADGVASSRSRYYKNPHAGVIVTLTANTNLILTVANTDPANTFSDPVAATMAPFLANAARGYIIELASFKSHTDNISGLTATTDGNLTAPNYDLATGVGQQILKITNATDDVANATPMLGSFTSLYIGDDLTGNNTIIANDWITMNSAIAPNGNCTLTGGQVNTINTHITTANSLISTRRNHDFNFYQKSRAIVNDYIFLTRFDNLGNTQNYMVENLIGTDFLKSNLP